MSESLHVTYSDPDGNLRSFDVGPMIFMLSGTRATLHASTSVNEGSSLNFSATIERFDRSWVPLGYGDIILQFKQKGSKTWTDVTDKQLNASGGHVVSFTVAHVDHTGSWRVITPLNDVSYAQVFSNAVTVKVNRLR